MKILFLLFPIHQYDGILHHTNHLAEGLIELGHTVDLKVLSYSSGEQFIRSIPGKNTQLAKNTFFVKSLDKWCHLKYGWIFDKPNDILKYNTDYNFAKTLDTINSYDLVYYLMPYASIQKSNRGNIKWLKLIEQTTVRKISTIHDGSAYKTNTQFAFTSELFDGIACVHQYAYEMSKNYFNGNFALIVNPFKIETNLDSILASSPYENRLKGVFTWGFFKGWKRFDQFVRAVPFMKFEHKLIAGFGVEYAYMTSQDKIDPAYIYSDSQIEKWNLPESYKGRRIWDVAIENNMKYLGLLNPSDRDAQIQKMLFCMDCSYKTDVKYEYFNRTVVETILNGSLPIVRSHYPNAILYNKNVTYSVPNGDNPIEFANYLNEIVNSITKSTFYERVANNYSLLKIFDYRTVAQQYIDLAFNYDSTQFLMKSKGSLSPKIKKDAMRSIGFFDGSVEAGRKSKNDYIETLPLFS